MRAPSSRRWSVGVALLAAAPGLEASPQQVPTHRVANWRKEPDYLLKFQYLLPGGKEAVLNSCTVPNLPVEQYCHGKGYCVRWDQEDTDPTAPKFCQCERDWADPECRTRRKSQWTAFVLSMFLGALGVDQFYLGFMLTGLFKLLTLGGLGTWWAYDVMRIGSAPVAAKHFQVAHDLGHYEFVLLSVSYMMTVGFFLVYFSTLFFRARRRQFAMAMLAEEEIERQDDAIAVTKAYDENYSEWKLQERDLKGPWGADINITSKYDVDHPSEPLWVTSAEAAKAQGAMDYGSMGSQPAKHIRL